VGNWDSSVSIVTCYRLDSSVSIVTYYRLDGEGLSPTRSKRFFCTPQCPDCLEAPPPSHLSNGYWGSFPIVKWPGCEADHSPPSSAEVKNGGGITQLPSMSSWCGAYLIKHRGTALPFIIYSGSLYCLPTLWTFVAGCIISLPGVFMTEILQLWHQCCNWMANQDTLIFQQHSPEMWCIILQTELLRCKENLFLTSFLHSTLGWIWLAFAHWVLWCCAELMLHSFFELILMILSWDLNVEQMARSCFLSYMLLSSVLKYQDFSHSLLFKAVSCQRL
jgi:hypothetical protein